MNDTPYNAEIKYSLIGHEDMKCNISIYGYKKGVSLRSIDLGTH